MIIIRFFWTGLNLSHLVRMLAHKKSVQLTLPNVLKAIYNFTEHYDEAYRCPPDAIFDIVGGAYPEIL